jgi:hypothetical protein
MAEKRRNWLWPVLLAVLLVGAGAVGAQTAGSGASGALTGKLTDLHSAPLQGVTVVLRNERTGAETREKTQKNGSFRFTSLEPGAYTVVAESAQLGRGQLEGVIVSAGAEARVQAAMAFEAVAAPAAETAVVKAIPLTSMTPHAALPATAAMPAVAAYPAMGRNETAAAVKDSSPPLMNRLATATENVQLTREKPETVAPVVIASMADEPLLNLSLTGQPEPKQLDPKRLEPKAVSSAAGGAGAPAHPVALMILAMSEAAAASALPRATESIRPVMRPVQTASEREDPAAAATVTTTTAAEIQALPMAGRRWQNFVMDTPTASTAAGGTSAPALRGAGQQPADTSIDGTNIRMAFGGQGNSGPELSGQGANGRGGSDQNEMGQAWAGGRGTQVAEAAIREVQTAAGNAEAVGARTAGGRINVDTAHGSNGLHGQGFAFDRQNTWGAQNPFTAWVKETSPATLSSTPAFTAEPYTPPDRETVWGVGIGSQLRRDKLFWFGALDNYSRNDPGLATVKHPAEFFAQPSNDQMQVLSARLGLSAANPIAEGLAAYSGMLNTLDGLLGPSPRTAEQWVGFGRLDWEASERHRFSLEGIGARWNSPGGGLTRVSEAYGTNSFGSSRASEELLIGRWEAFVTPNLLAVTQGSVGRNILSARAEAPSTYEQSFLAPSVWGQLPQMVVDSRYGFTIGNPSRFGSGSYPDERVGQAQETLNWVRGNIFVKSGFELSHNADATSLLRNETGTYSYSSVENFVSDALAFAMFGVAGELQPDNQHNCDETGKVWRDSGGGLRGLGYLPCYSYYSQIMGPTNWNLSTNDWAGFVTTQWQPGKLLVVSGGLRWEREQLPPPIPALNNPDLPLTQKLPSLGNDWGPRISLALGSLESHWPVLRLGYGMYFGRTENATVETALTQTGSANGDRNFFMRPTDNLNAGGAPPFPYVLSGAPGSVVKPGAVEFAPRFRNVEIHQAVASAEETLPGHIEMTASALVSLGRRLPVFIDTNIDLAGSPQPIVYGVTPNSGPTSGPIQTPQTLPLRFYSVRLNPDYQQIDQITSKANSTYEAAMLKITRYGRRGLTLHAHYTYSHTMDWNPNESPLDPSPANFSQEYGTSDQDVRHSAAAMVIYETPWKLRNLPGKLANGWTVSGIGNFRSGSPYTMRVTGSLPEEYSTITGEIEALGPGMNGSGGDNRVFGVGRNTYRYPYTWKLDMRLAKDFDLGHMRQLELLAESFNLFNHQNVTELESIGYYIERGSSGELPSLNVLTIPPANITVPPSASTPAFGQPLNVNATNFYRERQIQVGIRMRF